MTWKFATMCVALAALIALGAAGRDLALTDRAMAHGEHIFAAGKPGNPKKAFRVIEVTMTDGPGTMSYEPSRIEENNSEQIKFVLKNTGDLPPEFLLDWFENNAKHKLGMERNPEME